jgi:Protein of unknown function (DUF664)
MSEVTPVPRAHPIQQGSERAMLESMLDFYRATVVNKVVGLTDAQAFAAAVPPSTLTPATVVKHLTGTERNDMDFTLRYAMIHLIQETARHCGHLDLLRETTDGAVGG